MQLQNIPHLDSHIELLAPHSLGKQLFVVGGAIRDILLGINTDPTDIDMTLVGEPDDVFAALQDISSDSFSLFRTEKFGTMTLVSKDSPTIYELTPFREEGGYADHRHPEKIQRSHSLLADAKRRDFSINCLYYTVVHFSTSSSRVDAVSVIQETHSDFVPLLVKQGWYYRPEHQILLLQNHELIEQFFVDGVFQTDTFSLRAERENIAVGDRVRFVIDPFGGIQDLRSGVIRAVGSAVARFEEDALRILRAVRIANLLNQQLSHGNFDFEKATWSAMKELAPLVMHIAKERIHQEIVKVFSAKNPFGWIAIIDELGLLKDLFPALYQNKNDEQPVRYHPFDTYAHTLLTLWHLQDINDDYLVKLGMLYHDVGKKDQYEAYSKATTKEQIEEIHRSEANHVISGPNYAQRDFRELGFSNKEIEEIQFYIAQHMRPGQILTAREDNQIKKMRQLLSEYGYERVKNLLDITVADRKGQFNPLQSNEIDTVQSLYTILKELYDTEGQFTMRQLAINGDLLMSEFGLTPWPQIKEKLQLAFDRVLVDIAQRNTQDAIISYLRSLE